MYKSSREQIASITGSATARVYTDYLRQNVRRMWADLLFAGSINVTGAGSQVVNRGSILGAWNYVGLNDGGDDVIKIDARTLGFVTDLLIPSARSTTRLGGTGTGTTALIESVRLHYGWPLPFQAVPAETVHIQKNVENKIRYFGELRGDGGAPGILSGGTKTMSVAPTISIVETYDDLSTDKPKFIPEITQDVITVSSSNTALRYDVTVNEDALRGIVIQQDSNLGEVGDILSALKLTIGGRTVIGPPQATLDNLLRGMELTHGGGVYATGTGFGQSSYLFIGFEENARLSNVQSAKVSNFRFEFNVAPSGQSGVTSSSLRLTFLGLNRTPGIVSDNLGFSL